MRILGESVKARYLELIGKPVSFPSGGYKGDYIKDIALKILKEKGNKLSDKDDNIFKTTAETLMFNEIKKTLLTNIAMKKIITIMDQSIECWMNLSKWATFMIRMEQHGSIF